MCCQNYTDPQISFLKNTGLEWVVKYHANWAKAERAAEWLQAHGSLTYCPADLNKCEIAIAEALVNNQEASTALLDATHAAKAAELTAKAAAKALAAPASAFSKGATVTHKAFGPGIVTNTQGEIITVDFSGSIKTLVASVLS